jgi:hypothetical protein
MQNRGAAGSPEALLSYCFGHRPAAIMARPGNAHQFEQSNFSSTATFYR